MRGLVQLRSAMFAGVLAAVAASAGHAAAGPGGSTVRQTLAPADAEPATIVPGGVSVLPNGRFVTPAGDSVRITAKAYGLALSPDGRSVVALHDKALTLIELDAIKDAVRVPSYDKTIPPVFDEGGFMGAAFSPDGRTIYLSNGQTGGVVLVDRATRRRVGAYPLDGVFQGATYTDSLAGEMKLSPDGATLYVLDRANYRLVGLERATGRVVSSVKVGRLPLGLALSPDGRKAYVANVGLYEYPLVPGVTKDNRDTKMLAISPYATDTEEAEKGVTLADGRRLPGLGSARAPEAMSVFVVDLRTNAVTARLKPGLQIGQMVGGEEVVGGSSPSGVVVGRRFAYVTTATNDKVVVLDTRTDRIVGEIRLDLHPSLDARRGLMPFDLALSPDERRLYVTCLTLNAVAVIDTASRRVLGYVPTGWGPTRVRLSADGRSLYVVSARGLGAGPNGGRGFVTPPQGAYVGDIQLGLFQAIPVPDVAGLKAMTERVLANTLRTVETRDDGRNPVPAAIGLRKSPIKYVVYVTKENRTFDDVFGGLPGVNGDPTIARNDVWDLVGVDGSVLKGARISPNHQTLAQRFALSDNFYADSDASVHGHRWMIGTAPNGWMESNTANSKAWDAFSAAPGRRFPDSSGGMDPEDYNEIGGLWEQLARHKVDFWNYGQGVEFAGVWEEEFHMETGLRMPVIYPMAKAVLKRTATNYAGFNMNIPDQFRMDQFERDVTLRYLSGKAPFPTFIALQLPNDHGADPRPADGFPYRASFTADNDLALGRFVQFLSHTPYWKEMAIVVVEDDPQGGVDHVDAHRSILMVISPWAKKGYVSHRHANFGAVLKTMYHVLDLPPVNQFDLAANLLDDMFTDTPDFTPYDALPVDKRVFDPDVAMQKYGVDFDWRQIKGGEPMDDEDRQRAAFEAAKDK